MPVKDIHLKQLEREIKDTISNYWLFPAQEEVQGFMGTGGINKIMFVGERPSSIEHGIDSHRMKFYEVLKQYDLGDCHLTDLIKSRGKVNDPYPNNGMDDWRFLKREIAIIEPRLVFALSTKVHNYLFFYLLEKRIITFPIYHYSYAFRYNKVQQFKAQIKQGLKKIQELETINN